MRRRALYVTLGCIVVLAALMLMTRPSPVERAAPAPRPRSHSVPVAPDASAPLPVEAPRTAPDAARHASVRPVAGVVFRAPWGSAPGEFGRLDANESNPEAPMAIAVAADGSVLALDQVNRRVQRFRDGAFVSAFPVPTAAVQDLAVTPDGRVAVLDRLGASAVTLYDAQGNRLGSVPLVGGAITEGGAASGLFVDAHGVWVEREHQELVRVADADGVVDTQRPTRFGRLSQDGHTLLRAALVDRASGVVEVRAAARENGAMDWSARVPFGALVLHIVLLDGDGRGNVYVGASVARVLPGDPETLVEPATIVARVDSSGAVTGTLRLPALPPDAEVFRPLTVDADGVIFLLLPDARGVEVRRFVFDT